MPTMVFFCTVYLTVLVIMRPPRCESVVSVSALSAPSNLAVVHPTDGKTLRVDGVISLSRAILAFRIVYRLLFIVILALFLQVCSVLLQVLAPVHRRGARLAPIRPLHWSILVGTW